jgi:hypothetical protein
MKNIKNLFICSIMLLTITPMTDSIANNSSSLLKAGTTMYCSRTNYGGAPWSLKLTLTPDESTPGPIAPIIGSLDGPEWYGLGFQGVMNVTSLGNGQYILSYPDDPVPGRTFTLSSDQNTATVNSSTPVCTDPEDWTVNNCYKPIACFSSK